MSSRSSISRVAQHQGAANPPPLRTQAFEGSSPMAAASSHTSADFPSRSDLLRSPLEGSTGIYCLLEEILNDLKEDNFNCFITCKVCKSLGWVTLPIVLIHLVQHVFNETVNSTRQGPHLRTYLCGTKYNGASARTGDCASYRNINNGRRILADVASSTESGGSVTAEQILLLQEHAAAGKALPG